MEIFDKPLGESASWEYTITYDFTIDMLTWVLGRKLKREIDWDLHSFRLPDHPRNSHRWSFKDGKYLTAFILACC